MDFFWCEDVEDVWGFLGDGCWERQRDRETERKRRKAEEVKEKEGKGGKERKERKSMIMWLVIPMDDVPCSRFMFLPAGSSSSYWSCIQSQESVAQHIPPIQFHPQNITKNPEQSLENPEKSRRKSRKSRKLCQKSLNIPPNPEENHKKAAKTLHIPKNPEKSRRKSRKIPKNPNWFEFPHGTLVHSWGFLRILEDSWGFLRILWAAQCCISFAFADLKWISIELGMQIGQESPGIPKNLQ